jgi:Lrp/AsnC family leucine-responsive transcriptional regulator
VPIEEELSESSFERRSVAAMAVETSLLDPTDRRILEELATDARLTLAELGRRVNLSPPAARERLQRLERTGVIKGYHAEIDATALGYPLTAIVRVRPAARQLPKIQELAASIPEVSECHRITGEDCFFLKIHLRSLDELDGVLDQFLVHGQTTTSLVQSTPLPHRPPPLGG